MDVALTLESGKRKIAGTFSFFLSLFPLHTQPVIDYRTPEPIWAQVHTLAHSLLHTWLKLPTVAHLPRVAEAKVKLGEKECCAGRDRQCVEGRKLLAHVLCRAFFASLLLPECECQVETHCDLVFDSYCAKLIFCAVGNRISKKWEVCTSPFVLNQSRAYPIMVFTVVGGRGEVVPGEEPAESICVSHRVRKHSPSSSLFLESEPHTFGGIGYSTPAPPAIGLFFRADLCTDATSISICI